MKSLSILRRFAVLSALAVAMFGMTACDDDEAPEAENESEVITTVKLTFTPQGGGDALVYQAIDADGDGPGNIQIDDITLSANATYTVALEFLNELESPAEDITEEVEEEGQEHQIFYTVDPSNLLSVAYSDQDAGGLPIGLSTTWTTLDAGNGTVSVVLKHQPDIKTGSSGINDGETDINVNFVVILE